MVRGSGTVRVNVNRRNEAREGNQEYAAHRAGGVSPLRGTRLMLPLHACSSTQYDANTKRFRCAQITKGSAFGDTGYYGAKGILGGIDRSLHIFFCMRGTKESGLELRRGKVDSRFQH